MWQFWLIFGILLLIFEMFTPIMFCLNLAFACFVVAIASYFGFGLMIQGILFLVISIILLVFLRPFLLKTKTSTNKHDIIDEKYVNHNAKAINNITKYSGRIAIYGEEWEARIKEDNVVAVGEEVKIISFTDGLMIVEKI